jgi:serine/threonine-protein kinase RsbW
MRLDAEITVVAPEISQLTQRTTDFLNAGGVDMRAAHRVALVLDEMLTNIAMHGGDERHSAAVHISIETGCVQGEIIDTGPPFDPRSTADPDVNAGIADRPIGGLGVYLIRQLTSALDYVRRDGRNCTTFSVLRTNSAQGEA